MYTNFEGKNPAYATESKEALENLQNAYEQNGYDMYCPKDINIWVNNGNGKNKGGAFKFECNAGLRRYSIGVIYNHS